MKEFCNLKLSADVVSQINDEGMMVYCADEGMVHMLNTTASEIFQLIEGGSNSLNDLVKKFILKYNDVDQGILISDIKEILLNFETNKIIIEWKNE
ncbi:MAG: PqqD family protein [Bacteroidales bacterium]|jgi:hypothetical protein|nr:PqqD family protein [Bacteroidales bacterium]